MSRWSLLLPLLVACSGDSKDIGPIDTAGGDDTPTDTTDTTDTPSDTPTDTTDTPSDTPAGASPLACINEVMTSNLTTVVLRDGTAPDWIELHNPTDRDIDLEGWTISDDPAVPDKHTLPAGLRVRAGGFLLLYADDDIEDGPDHVGFSLDRDGGETLVLTDDQGNSASVALGPAAIDFAIARETDCCSGADCWISVAGGTPGRTNAP
jgi:hypothetical protein